MRAREATDFVGESVEVLRFSLLDGFELVHLLRLRLLPQNGRVVLDVILEDRLSLGEVFGHKYGTIVFVHRLGELIVRLALYESLRLV